MMDNEDNGNDRAEYGEVATSNEEEQHNEEFDEDYNEEEEEEEEEVSTLPEGFRRQMQLHGTRQGRPDPSMEITETERGWAMELQRAVADNLDEFPHPPLICDMDYAQHAIFAEGNTQEALQRLIGLHKFYDEYGIDHSSEQTLFYLREFMKQQPGYVLHMDYDPVTYDSLNVLDATQWFPNRALEPSRERGTDFNWRVNIVGYYYIHHFLFPSLATARKGVLGIVECDGLSWENFNIEYDSRLHAELFSFLPLKLRDILFYNTSTVANVIINLIKPVMPRHMRESLQLGCTLVEPDGSTSSRRLSELYLQPNLQAAEEKVLQKMANLVAIRLYNETTFRL